MSTRITQASSEAAAEALDDEARVAASEGIEWAARYAESIDPLKRVLRMPEDLDSPLR